MPDTDEVAVLVEEAVVRALDHHRTAIAILLATLLGRLKATGTLDTADIRRLLAELQIAAADVSKTPRPAAEILNDTVVFLVRALDATAPTPH